MDNPDNTKKPIIGKFSGVVTETNAQVSGPPVGTVVKGNFKYDLSRVRVSPQGKVASAEFDPSIQYSLAIEPPIPGFSETSWPDSQLKILSFALDANDAPSETMSANSNSLYLLGLQPGGVIKLNFDQGPPEASFFFAAQVKYSIVSPPAAPGGLRVLPG